MKSAEEWRLEYKQQQQDSLSGKKRTLVFNDDSFVRAIQLDAAKAGALWAARKFGSSYNLGTQHDILTGSEKLKLEDLK